MSFTRKLIKNVLHDHAGAGPTGIIVAHGLGGTFGETQQLCEMLHKKYDNKQIINLSLPLHNDAPEPPLHDPELGWQSRDIESMLSTIYQEYSLEKCHLIGTAFTGYPIINFYMNNPNLVESFISQSWMIKATDRLINDPRDVKQNERENNLSDFKASMIKMLTNDGKAPAKVIDYVTQMMGNFSLDQTYKAQIYVYNCYIQFGHPYQAFKSLFDTEKSAQVLYVGRQSTAENEKIIADLKDSYYPRFDSRTFGETLFLTVEQVETMFDVICKHIDKMQE